MPYHRGDLAFHASICIRENDEDVTLRHMRPADSRCKSETLRIHPSFVTNDGCVVRRWAEDGISLMLRSQ